MTPQKRFESCFPGSVVVGRAAADERASQILSKFPRLMQLRSPPGFNWGLKALDPFLWGEAEYTYHFDTDIIVFDDMSELLEGLEDAVWSKDTWWSAITPEAELVPTFSPGPLPQLNGGLGEDQKAAVGVAA